MIMMSKRLFWPTFLVSGLAFSALPQRAWAFCPLCVAGTGAGMGIFRWLGLDDTIIGLWLGGFILSTSVWLNNYLAGKGIKTKLQLPIIAAGFYLLNFVFLSRFDFLNYPYNKLWGVNKLILGTVFGSLALAAAFYADKFLRRKNKGKVFVSFQKLIIPVSLLVSLSLIFHFIID